MPKTMYDAAYPPANPPVTDAVLIYAGGDTPHVWTPAEIAAQRARYRLPCWVRSNAGASASQDADGFISWLRARACPQGVATVLDLETLVDPAYVTAFGQALHAAGWQVLPYGSRSTLGQNPRLDGYFDAHPGDPAGTVDPGDVATQDVYAGAYDLDTLLDSVPLWDTQATAGDPVDTHTNHDALMPGYGLPGVPEVAVIGKIVGPGGAYRGRNVTGGKTVYALEDRPTGYQTVSGFDPKTLAPGTPIAVALHDLSAVSTVVQTEEL